MSVSRLRSRLARSIAWSRASLESIDPSITTRTLRNISLSISSAWQAWHAGRYILFTSQVNVVGALLRAARPAAGPQAPRDDLANGRPAKRRTVTAPPRPAGVPPQAD